MTQLEKTREELRKFGCTFGLILAAIFGVLVPVMKKKSFSLWPWIIAGVFITISMVRPQSLKIFDRVFSKFSEFLGSINTRIILTLIYYLLIVPVGFIMKMGKKNKVEKMSYRIEKKTSTPMDQPY